MKSNDLFNEFGIIAEKALLSDNESLFIGGFAGGTSPMDYNTACLNSSCSNVETSCGTNTSNCIANCAANCSCPTNKYCMNTTCELDILCEKNPSCSLINGVTCNQNYIEDKCSKNI